MSPHGNHEERQYTENKEVVKGDILRVSVEGVT